VSIPSRVPGLLAKNRNRWRDGARYEALVEA